MGFSYSIQLGAATQKRPKYFPTQGYRQGNWVFHFKLDDALAGNAGYKLPPTRDMIQSSAGIDCK